MLKKTARKILDLPKSELTEEKLTAILEKNLINVKLEMKKQILLLLIECYNQQKTITEAIVLINNLQDEQ